MHWVPTGQKVNKEYYFEVLREFRKSFRRKKPALFKSGQWHFHQDNAPVHNSILVTDHLTKRGIKTVPHHPYSPDHAPCHYWLFPKLKEKLRGCRYETIEEMKEDVTKVIDTLTRGLPRSIPGVVGTVQVHCSRRRLLRKELEIHVCTINKKAHTKKYGNLLKVPRIYLKNTRSLRKEEHKAYAWEANCQLTFVLCSNNLFKNKNIYLQAIS